MTAFVLGALVGMLIVWEFELDYPRWLWNIRRFFEELLKTLLEKLAKNE